MISQTDSRLPATLSERVSHHGGSQKTSISPTYGQMEAWYRNILLMDGEQQSSRTSTSSLLVSVSSKVTASAARGTGLFVHANAHNAGTTVLYHLRLRWGPQTFPHLKMRLRWGLQTFPHWKLRRQQVAATRSEGSEGKRPGGAYPVGQPRAPLTVYKPKSGCFSTAVHSADSIGKIQPTF